MLFKLNTYILCIFTYVYLGVSVQRGETHSLATRNRRPQQGNGAHLVDVQVRSNHQRGRRYGAEQTGQVATAEVKLTAWKSSKLFLGAGCVAQTRRTRTSSRARTSCTTCSNKFWTAKSSSTRSYSTRYSWTIRTSRRPRFAAKWPRERRRFVIYQK